MIYAVKIQLKAKEYYNIIVKNEAHIRMASSSYWVATKSRWVVFASVILLFSLIQKVFPESHGWDLLLRAACVLWLPIGVFWLNWFIKKSVINFLHYQRLREIFFVLKVYDEFVKKNESNK